MMNMKNYKIVAEISNRKETLCQESRKQKKNCHIKICFLMNFGIK